MARPPSPSVGQFYSEGDPQLTPERLVAHNSETRSIKPEQIGVKPVVVATFHPQETSFLAERYGAQRSDMWTLSGRERDLFVLDDRICITTLPIGAPAAILTFEELVAYGARSVVVTGAAGSLQPHLPIGSVVLPTTAIREEGTSHHYLPSDASAVPAATLVEALRAAWSGSGPEPRAGPHWTTDAPYREHKQKIAAYREAGVLSVDMEVSALFAVAQHRGVACAAILAISDELFEPWRIGFGTQELVRALARASVAAVEAALSLPGQS